MDSLFDVQNFLVTLANSPLPFTDIHIEQDAPVVVKMPRGWEPVDDEGKIAKDSPPCIIGHDEIGALLGVINPHWETLTTSGREVARAIVLSNIRMRCNAFSIRGNTRTAISIRRLPRVPPTPAEIGLPPHVINSTSRAKGLILVTGPTGAGKTTTIASLLNHINETRSAHIITIEKPIEYELERKKSVISQKEVGVDTLSFHDGLESALQQRPTVIMIGEIRDKLSAETTLHAAESGHLVLATMHASSADGAIAKLMSFFEDDNSKANTIASNLVMVIGQNLACVHAEGNPAGKLRLVAEFLVNSPLVAKAISDGQFGKLRELMRPSDDSGSRLMNAVLLEMIQTKEIQQAEALRVSYDPTSLRDQLLKLSSRGKAPGA